MSNRHERRRAEAEMRRLVEDRNAALLTLDRATIVAYLRRYGEEPHLNEEIFWAGIHKARLSIPTLGDDAHIVSRQWLAEHGFKPVEVY
jgi:hypothetical protein